MFRVTLDGTAEGGFTAPPALDDAASVRITSLDLTIGPPSPSAEIDLDFGDGRTPAQTVVEMDCSL